MRATRTGRLVHWERGSGRAATARTAFSVLVVLLCAPGGAHAAAGDEMQFVFNTFSFLIWGGLVMWMAAGFTMLEAGSVRTKNAAVICLKNIGLYAIAGIAYYVIGYSLMYIDVQGWIGSFKFLYGPSADEVALLNDQEEAQAAVIANGYSVMSDWFFQMVFVATAASIVSGALAERVKLWSFFFTLVLTAFMYPIVGAWTWGGGWLNELGFQDFAGSTIVHGTGGWAALAGALIVGPRRGKFRRDGTVRPTPPFMLERCRREGWPPLPRTLSPQCRRWRKPPLRQVADPSPPQRREAPGGAWPGPAGGDGSDRLILGYQIRTLAWSARRNHSCAT